MTAVPTDPQGHYLLEALGKPFTDEQLRAATAGLHPVLVVAGAGSGKTAVMAARVVHLVAHQGIEPARILGLTFTAKAAAELAARVRATLRGYGATSVDDLPTVLTYHAYAAGVVRDHALRIGREPQSRLLTEAARWQLAARAVSRAQGPFRYLKWRPASVTQKVLALDGELAEHLVEPEQLAQFDEDFARRVDALDKPTTKLTDCATAARARAELLAIVRDYRDLKQVHEAIDFGDQVALAARIAETAPEVGEIERARFDVVLLDEYQDTGVAQRLLLQRLFGDGHPVTAVGDPNQGIYGWRGASVGNLARFPEHFARHGGQPAPLLELMTSFRCGGRILSVANAVAAKLSESPASARRPPVQVRPLSAPEGQQDAGQVRVALLADVEQEARWVAESIGDAVLGAGLDGVQIPAGECAVLCRRRTDFPLLHKALVARGLPVEVVGLGGLLEMPEVADVVATLRVLVDPVANAALVRLLTGVRWRIGARDLATLGRRASWLVKPPEDTSAPLDDDGLPPAEAALRSAAERVDPVEVVSLSDALDDLGPEDRYSPEAYARMTALAVELSDLRHLLGQPIVDLVSEVVRRTGLDVEIDAEPARVAEARAANLAAFSDHAAQFTSFDGESDLRSFLAYLDAAADVENGLDAGGVSSADTVKILTVHKAKGLEWDVVAVPSLTEKVFPSGQGRPRWTSRAEVLPYPLRGDSHDLPPGPELTSPGLKAFEADCGAESDDEERRLGYVAFTRAKSLLLLSGAWWSATRTTTAGPSTLLLEAKELEPLVDVVRWDPQPEDGAGNPLLEQAATDVPWPEALDASAHSRRETAAALVDSARAGELDEPPLDLVESAIAAEWDAEIAVLVSELQRQRSTERVVALPRRLTASQVVLLAEDEAELARRLARPVPERPIKQARRGTRFHAWAEGLFGDHPLIDTDELPGAADDAEVGDAELAELQSKFLASEYGERQPVAVEQPFELVVGGRILRGRIDAVYDDVDGGFDVIDYKTGDVPRDFAAASLQLSIYRLAWAGLRRIDPARVNAGFFYVKHGQTKRPSALLSEDELAAVLSGSARG